MLYNKYVIDQWFSNLSWRHPCSSHFVCLPHLTHPIQLISSLVETARPELGVSDKWDIQNVQSRGASRTGLKTTDIDYNNKSLIAHIHHRDVYVTSASARRIFRVFAHLQYVYRTLPIRCQIDVLLLKGYSHPKIKMLSLITYPHVVPNP